jgi:subtilisin family serine protease
MSYTTTNRAWAVLLALPAILLAVPGPTVVAARDLPPPALEAAARRTAGQVHGVPPGRLDVLNQVTATYPTLNREGVSFKLQDRGSGQLYTVLLGRDGEVWDRDAVEAQERSAYDGRFGRLDTKLFERLKQARDDEELEVVAWLRTDRVPAPLPAAGDELGDQAAEQYFAQRARQRVEAIPAVQSALAPRVANWGGAARYDAHQPVMHARMSAVGVRAMGTWPELDRVYLAERVHPQLDVARSAIGAKTVHEGSGVNGTGVKVAVIEAELNIAAGNPNLPGIVRDQENACRSSALGSHGTLVAGVIGSTLSTHLGIAPGATLRTGGSCSGEFAEVTAASTRASAWGANVFNLSFGSHNEGVLTAFDRFYDELVYGSRHTVVAAAGNIVNSCPELSGDYVGSPATAYNVIAVGNYDDKNTVELGDDTMSRRSACDDPVSVHGDREKPELAAPGEKIASLDDEAPWGTVSASGTSMASPMVAGVAALLMDRNPNLLRAPEAIKAILMASATHNLEGAARLSEQDGAGGVRALNADQIARQLRPTRTFQRGTIVCGSTGSVDNIKEIARVTLFGFQRLRVALAWSTDPGFTDYSSGSQPHADLDLLVNLVSTGQRVASSTSHDNTYEIVDFFATASGEYSLRTSTTCAAGDVIPYGVAILD